MPNAIMRARRARGNIVGSQLDDCVDAAGLAYRRAFEKVPIQHTTLKYFREL